MIVPLRSVLSLLFFNCPLISWPSPLEVILYHPWKLMALFLFEVLSFDVDALSLHLGFLSVDSLSLYWGSFSMEDSLCGGSLFIWGSLLAFTCCYSWCAGYIISLYWGSLSAATLDALIILVVSLYLLWGSLSFWGISQVYLLFSF